MDNNPPIVQQQPQNSLANYQFSSEELRVLRECNAESFFQRSLPLGIGLGVSSYLAVNHGYIKPNVKFGAWPTVIMSSVVGYFLGKFSYQQKCAEKLMMLPNSKIAEALRERHKGGAVGSFIPDRNTGVSLSPFNSYSEDIYSDVEKYSDRNFVDADVRHEITELDDIYRPSLDSNSSYIDPALPILPSKQGKNYEQLREENREKYNKSQKSFLSRNLPLEKPAGGQMQEKPKPHLAQDDNEQSFDGKTNKYGDSWS